MQFAYLFFIDETIAKAGTGMVSRVLTLIDCEFMGGMVREAIGKTWLPD
ncbi:MAG: hypothetical protein JXD19_02980 [Deltaproteobacteria bacterium]|nr:hypothetical protein [Deltaproteobacteria bacterium]